MFANHRFMTIEWRDCDPAGIVFRARYIAMFDESTAALFAVAFGFDRFGIRQRLGSVGFPVVETSAKYLRPSRYGETGCIERRITRLGRSSFNVAHRLLRGEDLAIEASEARVWASVDPERPRENSKRADARRGDRRALPRQ